MKISVKGVYEKRKPLADGRTAVYHYHRKSGARVMAAPGTVAFLQEVERLNGGRASVVAVPNSVKDLFRLYRASGHFKDLADRTRSEYIRALDQIEPMIGGFQVKDVRRKHAMMIRDKLAADRPAWANAVVRVLSAALTFAKDLEWIESSPCQKMGFPKGGEGQIPLSEAEIARFRDAEPYGTRARLGFEIMLGSACRIDDGTHVETDALRGDVVSIVSGKTGALTVSLSTDHLKAAFDAWDAVNLAKGTPLGRYALGGRNGKPLNRRTLTADMETAYTRAGFPPEKRTHALRYTAATRLLEAGFGIEDIQEVTGHAMAAMAWKYCRKKRAASRTAAVFNRFDRAQVLHP